ASFAALIAAAGLAVGLAFQGTLSNFAAGVMLLVFRPFKVGDLVTTAGNLGIVQEIELFTTELSTLDNRKIVVPNGSIFGSVIENLTHNDTRRVDVPVGVEYSADVDETRKVLEAMIPSIPAVLEDPAPQVFLAELGASSVDWQVRVWCKTEDYWDVYQATIRAAKMALDEAKLGIPFPQMDVHLDGPSLALLSGKKPMSSIGAPIGK
ncbi:MAG: mechanosensitive ion channel family protein, partial [Deltaproteobacteria bacterium]|nr:mechanosensitive ion channel family protein [Deltaproteobacteria bacterium]